MTHWHPIQPLTCTTKSVGIICKWCYSSSQIYYLVLCHPWSPSYPKVEVPRVKYSLNMLEFIYISQCTISKMHSTNTVAKPIFTPSLYLKTRHLTLKINDKYAPAWVRSLALNSGDWKCYCCTITW